MFWLFGIVALLQSLFYWFLKPAIISFSPIFEFRGISILIVVLAAWCISVQFEK